MSKTRMKLLGRHITAPRFALFPVIIISCFTLVLSVSSCGTETSGTKTSANYSPPQDGDFAEMAWTDAFDKLLEKMEREYAFTEWKSIDWESLGRKYRPLIEEAQSAGDFEQYYIGLRGFLANIADGHVIMSGDDRGVKKSHVGGGFGIVALKLDDSRIVAVRVTPESPADAVGIRAGAELIQWGGKAVDEALTEASTIFFVDSLATEEDVTYARLMFLVRAPVGETRQVTFENPGDTAATTVTLAAVDDGMETLAFTNPFFDFSTAKPQKMVEAKTLPENVGYVKIIAEADLPETQPGDHTPTVQEFKQAIDSFIDANVTGILVDVRGNLGGDDSMVAGFLSSFYKDRTLYEYQNWYNAKSGKMEIWLGSDQTREYGDPGKSLDIVPGTPRYDGPIVAIVNTGCISSGEGVAMGVKNLPNGEVVGFWGTNGSFGMSGDEARMPDGLTVSFPFGQSLDKDKVIQLDSRNGVGGVAPTKRIPMTLENALRWGSGQDVELEYALNTLAEMGKGK